MYMYRLLDNPNNGNISIKFLEKITIELQQFCVYILQCINLATML